MAVVLEEAVSGRSEMEVVVGQLVAVRAFEPVGRIGLVFLWDSAEAAADVRVWEVPCCLPGLRKLLYMVGCLDSSVVEQTPGLV